MWPVADITLNAESILWLGGPFVASAAILMLAYVVRRLSRLAAQVLFVIGGAGLVLSILWLGLVFYIDAVERR